MYLTAACIFLFNPTTDRVMTVTRRGSSQIGLPGGKVDPGETAVIAACRELFEETGIVWSITDPSVKFIDVCFGKDGNHYQTETFFDIYVGELPTSSKEDGIFVQWSTIDELLINSPFVEYNHKLLEWRKQNVVYPS